ncbi:hypothetical protein HYALB_00004122 [Hymenoscyphus albidus]|uniref:Uncharacterized protein n=1 Tax=Hymenoscyphus albidus TaxID=595503 RepID=A0A9N9LKU9_9HELO|nr:hypothetical protein HYALB_00004122 [Hymenoscyphus albidus]
MHILQSGGSRQREVENKSRDQVPSLNEQNAEENLAHALLDNDVFNLGTHGGQYMAVHRAEYTSPQLQLMDHGNHSIYTVGRIPHEASGGFAISISTCVIILMKHEACTSYPHTKGKGTSRDMVLGQMEARNQTVGDHTSLNVRHESYLFGLFGNHTDISHWTKVTPCLRLALLRT